MAFASLNKYYASDTYDAMDHYKDTMVSGGWTLHDTVSGTGELRYVMTSSGESGEEIPCYFSMFKDNTNANRIKFEVHKYWDNTTHTDTYKISCSYYAYFNTDDDGPFYIWASVTADSASLVVYTQNVHKYVNMQVISPLYPEPNGILQSSVTAGSNVVVQLDTGEATNFQAPKYYQIIDDNNREWVEVNDVDKANDQLTITTLSYNFSADARIGTQPWRWLFHNVSYQYGGYNFRHDLNGSTDQSYQYVGNVNYNMFAYQEVDPDERAEQNYPMWPHIYYEVDNVSVAGIQKTDAHTTCLRCYINTNKELPMSVGNHDTGTSTGSNTSTTLNDTTKSWATNAYQNKVVMIAGGTGIGQFRTISSNTATQLTISESWTTTPDATSEYTICDEGWTYLYIANSATYCSAFRMI